MARSTAASRSARGSSWAISPTATFCATVSHGNSAKVWKTTEASVFTPCSGWPRASTRPEVGSISPVRQRRMVDLPEPDWPSSASSSPSCTATSISSSTFRAWPPAVVNVLWTAHSSAIGGGVVMAWAFQSSL